MLSECSFYMMENTNYLVIQFIRPCKIQYYFFQAEELYIAIVKLEMHSLYLNRCKLALSILSSLEDIVEFLDTKMKHLEKLVSDSRQLSLLVLIFGFSRKDISCL